MAADVVRLLDSPTNPHGRRYSPEEKEAAYQLWRTTAGRSHRRVAEATGIAASTVGTWSQEDGWVERARREDDEDAKSVRRSIRAVVNEQVLKSVEVAVKLRDDEKVPPKTRLDAAVWLPGIGGVAPVKQAPDLTAPAHDQPAPERHLTPAPIKPPRDPAG